MSENSNVEQNSANSPKENANFWANLSNLKAFLALPKWLKIVLIALNAIFVAGIIGACALNIATSGKIYSAKMSLHEQKIALDSERNEIKGEFSYTARIQFKSLAALLRSSSISNVVAQGYAWDSAVDTRAFKGLTHSKRNVFFNSTQDLGALGLESLGVVEYKVDFYPLMPSLARYFVWIVVFILGGCVFYNSFKIYPFQANLTPITRKDCAFLGFAFVLCAGICGFTFWLGFPGTIGTDAASAYSFPKNNHNPVFIIYTLEFLTFLFGRHIYYFFILNLVPFYLGLFFLIAGFCLRSKNPFALMLIFPTFIGNFYFSLFLQAPLYVVVSLYVCFYALLLFLILVPLNATRTQKIFSKILWTLLFVLMFVAILWRHNAIFAVFPAFLVICYIFLKNRKLDSKKFIKYYVVLVFLSATLCVGIVKGMPKILIKGDEFRPAMHTFLHQIAGACVPANDESCFKKEWYNDGKTFEDIKRIYYESKTLADPMLKVFHNYEIKEWFKAITKYPSNFISHELRFFNDLWMTDGHSGKDSNEIQKEMIARDFKHIMDAPPNEHKITFTKTQEKIYDFIFENKIKFPHIMGVAMGFVLMIWCGVLLFYQKFRNELLIFSFSASFAGFWMAFFTAAFNPAVTAGYYMSPILPLSLMGFMGFVAFVLDYLARKK